MDLCSKLWIAKLMRKGCHYLAVNLFSLRLISNYNSLN